MNETYFIIMVNGVPEGVTRFWTKAVQTRDEMHTAHREAYILPVRAIESTSGTEPETPSQTSE
jgi:hypothetical protein